MDLNSLDIKTLHFDLREGKYKVKDVVNQYLNNIKEKNDSLNIYLNLATDIEDQVRRAQEMYDNDSATELTGVPIALKSNIMRKGQVTNCGSKILEQYKATYDATVIERLKKHGVVFLGTTNMDEFAMGGSTENSAYGPTLNPKDRTKVPGGSSGGSAAAVAANMALISLGTDTGGSIRQPASFCGVYGFKSSYGDVSRYGAMAMGSSLDQIGPFAKNIEDVEKIWDCIKGKDQYDMTSFNNEKTDIKGKYKIVVPKNFLEKVDDDVLDSFRKKIEEIKNIGHEVVEENIDILKYSLPVYYVIMFAEASSNLARLDGIRYGFKKDGDNLLDEYLNTRSEGFGQEVKRRIMLGTHVLSAGYADQYYDKSLILREKIKSDLANIFKKYDFIMTPTSPTLPFAIGEKEDPVSMYLADIFTVTANMTGVPAISIPGEEKKGLPVGIHFMAGFKNDRYLFDFAKNIK